MLSGYRCLWVQRCRQRRKNRRRRNPDRPDSILEHSLEDLKIEYLYKGSDWEEFSGKDPEFLHVDTRGRDFRVPYAIFDNEPEKTDQPDLLGQRDGRARVDGEHPRRPYCIKV